jgi:hypothetical protein
MLPGSFPSQASSLAVLILALGQDVRPGHAVPPPAEPALIVLALLDSFQVHGRPPVSGAYLSSVTGNTVSGPV